MKDNCDGLMMGSLQGGTCQNAATQSNCCVFERIKAHRLYKSDALTISTYEIHGKQ